MNVLETERLLLRPLTVDDAAFVLELVNEAAWLQFIGDKGVRSLEDARAYLLDGPIAMYARHGFGLCAVESKVGGIPMGICGLIKREGLDDVDLGFAFLMKFWGKGYARESARAMLEHGQSGHGLKRIVALTATDNEVSMRLLKSLGFQFDRVIRLNAGGPESKLFIYDGAASRA